MATAIAARNGPWFWLQTVFFAVNVFFFYACIVIPVGLDIGSRCQDTRGCARRMQVSPVLPGLPSYPVDLADGQWREFRGSLPLLLLALAGSAVASRLHEWYCRSRPGRAQQEAARASRVLADLGYGLALLWLQHGWHALIVLALLVMSYSVGLLTRGSRYRTGAAWAVGLATLLLKESYRVARTYPSLRILFDQRYGGMYSWHLPANFLVLRMVSFACDDHWAALAERDAKKLEGTADDSVSTGAETKPNSHRPHIEYNFINFVSYCLYPPLYMAGPIMTFNAYVSYLRRPAGDAWGVLLYAVRWAMCLAVLESGLRYFPMFAVVACGLFWELSPLQMAVAAYVLLKLMWLKFLLLWRFFRLWAMADGKVPPENMTRCMSNNCSLEQFWKGWHSSYNKWLVRYMYVPMGGRGNRMISVWLIFVFVAVWHDIEPKLLAWGLLNASFYLVEVLAKMVYHSAAVQSSGLPPVVLNGVSVLSSSTYICVLIGVNMIGYAIGLGGASDALRAVSGDDKWRELIELLIGTYYFLSIGVGVMRYLVRYGFSKE